MRRYRHRKGYVLVMTLVLIALAGLLLAGIARHSLQVALQAVRAQKDLQRRWGVVSCQQAVLLQAEAIFRDQEAAAMAAGDPLIVARQSAELEMGGMRFEILIADENAKVNINTLLARKGQTEVTKLARQAAAVGGLEVQLRPYRAKAGGAPLRAFDSWGQVFGRDSFEHESNPAQGLALATVELTCWGSGKLNFRRASEESLRRVCRWVTTDRATKRLLQLRQSDPPLELTALLDQLEIGDTERKKLGELLTDRSECHSLWLTVITPGRSWHEFLVCERAGQGSPKTNGFRW